jgi:hypothetical protein
VASSFSAFSFFSASYFFFISLFRFALPINSNYNSFGLMYVYVMWFRELLAVDDAVL